MLDASDISKKREIFKKKKKDYLGKANYGLPNDFFTAVFPKTGSMFLKCA